MKSNRYLIRSLVAVTCLSLFSVSQAGYADRAIDSWSSTAVHGKSGSQATSSTKQSTSVDFPDRYAAVQQLVQEQQYDQAIKEYKKLARRYKNRPVPLNDLGVIYRLQGKLELAVKQFNRVIRKFPEYAPAYENLADTLTILASAAYSKAAQHAGGSPVLQKKAELSADFHQLALHSVEDAQARERNRKNDLPVSQQVVNTMHSWINAWNERDLPTYLSHYSSAFVPAKGKAIEDWAKRHQDNFASSEYIRVYLDSIRMKKIDANTVSVSFRELYESNLYETSVSKEIVMQKIRNSWLIKSESHI